MFFNQTWVTIHSFRRNYFWVIFWWIHIPVWRVFVTKHSAHHNLKHPFGVLLSDVSDEAFKCDQHGADSNFIFWSREFHLWARLCLQVHGRSIVFRGHLQGQEMYHFTVSLARNHSFLRNLIMRPPFQYHHIFCSLREKLITMQSYYAWNLLPLSTAPHF